MKRTIIAFVLCSVMAFAGQAWALTIAGGIDVGPADTYLKETYLSESSSEAEELAWVKLMLGNDIVYVEKHEGLSWQETNQEGVWAFLLSDAPDYFLVKTGKIDGITSNHFLFDNSQFKSYAVLNLADIHVSDPTNIEKVSHLTDFSGTAPVPEPGTIVLLGAGLLGLGLYGRRRMKAK